MEEISRGSCFYRFVFNSSVLWQVVPSPTLYVSVSMSMPIDPHFALLLAHELFLKKKNFVFSSLEWETISLIC